MPHAQDDTPPHAMDAATAQPAASPPLLQKIKEEEEEKRLLSFGKDKQEIQIDFEELLIAKEAQVKACLETLKPLCVNYGARYRQE